MSTSDKLMHISGVLMFVSILVSLYIYGLNGALVTTLIAMSVAIGNWSHSERHCGN